MEIIKPACTLMLIAVAMALCIGFAYGITKEPIEEQKRIRETGAMMELLPQAVSFEKLDIDTEAYEFVNTVTAGYDGSGTQVGTVFSVTVNGYSGGIDTLVGIDNNGVISGVRIVTHSETPGLGAHAADPDFYEQYTGKYGIVKVTKGLASSDEIAAISAATITSVAVTNAVNSALEANKNIGVIGK